MKKLILTAFIGAFVGCSIGIIIGISLAYEPPKKAEIIKICELREDPTFNELHSNWLNHEFRIKYKTALNKLK